MVELVLVHKAEDVGIAGRVDVVAWELFDHHCAVAIKTKQKQN